MTAVGVRELKNKLSFYLKQVAQGRRIEVTHRGKVIAFLSPVKTGRLDRELLALVEEGVASWKGGKPRGSSNPIKSRGRLLSEIILKDRR